MGTDMLLVPRFSSTVARWVPLPASSIPRAMSVLCGSHLFLEGSFVGD